MSQVNFYISAHKSFRPTYDHTEISKSCWESCKKEHEAVERRVMIKVRREASGNSKRKEINNVPILCPDTLSFEMNVY